MSIRCLVVIATVTFVLTPVALGQALSLDEAVQAQLTNDCAAMGGENVEFGADLNAVCTMSFGSPSGTASSGQGGASSQSLTASVENRREARLEEEDEGKAGSKWSVYANGNYDSLDRNRTRFADGFDSDVQGLTVGGDYRVNDQWVAGAALFYTDHRGDFDAGGDFETNKLEVIVYASLLPAENMFVDLAAGYGTRDHDVNRRANFVEMDNGGNTNTFDGIVNSETDGKVYNISAQYGLDFQVGKFTLGPRLGADWASSTIDGYSETGGGAGTAQVNGVRGVAGLALVYEEQDIDSLQGTVGLLATRPVSTDFGVLLFQGSANYIHEFDNDPRSVNVRFAQDLRAAPTVFSFGTEEPDRGYVDLGLGMTVVLPRGIQTFIHLRGMRGNSQFDGDQATIGVRFEL